MTNYREIWQSINKESASDSSGKQVARRILSKNFVVFLASNYRNDIRLLYIQTNDKNIVLDNLPRFRGLEINLVTASLGGFENEYFIKLTQSIPNTDHIFELVMSDICDRIVSSKHFNADEILTKVLNEWKFFFENLENKVLSLSEQKGLYGELYFLKNYLFKKYSVYDSLLSWTGTDKTNHDFQIQKNAVEIKTSSSKQHKRVAIASEKQLDDTGLDGLFLGIITFNIHNSVATDGLVKMISDIFTAIADDFRAVYLFEIKLAKAGYNQLHSNKYKLGFSLKDITFYKVIEGFPRLVYSNLPNGIGDIKYTVMVAACKPFEIKCDILQLI